MPRCAETAAGAASTSASAAGAGLPQLIADGPFAQSLMQPGLASAASILEQFLGKGTAPTS